MAPCAHKPQWAGVGRGHRLSDPGGHTIRASALLGCPFPGARHRAPIELVVPAAALPCRRRLGVTTAATAVVLLGGVFLVAGALR